ncbi:MAG: hypothetical protein IPG39_18360 [Bacteroidetes bacterium]|nr:hypothetical protein [Bacteroidota bacterium]
MFHCTVDDPPGNLLTHSLYYSVIDMTANGGLGKVIIKNQALLNDTLNAGKLTTCKHANG